MWDTVLPKTTPVKRQPGSHVLILSQEAVSGLFGRDQGFELRDTLLILVPGPTSLWASLFRTPIEEATVAEQVLKTGTGAMWIDGCRIGSGIRQATAGVRTAQDSKGWGVGQGGSGYVKGTGALFTTEGRWPSNLLLVHASECMTTGVKRVRSHNPGNKLISATTSNAYGSYSTRSPIGHADTDGSETVDAWECIESCPVRVLDEQSGHLQSGTVASHHMRNSSSQPSNGGFHGHFGDTPLTGFGDAGGASRFFPQFSNLSEALSWLNRLVLDH